MPYADVVDLALYHPEHGFYSSGGQAGRRGDFITSPEVGPLFGHLEQRAKHPEAVLSLDELPPDLIAEGIVGVVIANELLDNLAFPPMQHVDGSPASAWVAMDGDALKQVFVHSFRPYRSETVYKSWVDQAEASGFVSWVLGSLLGRGRLIVIDYARLRGDEVEVRTFAEHGVAGDPLSQLGTKDITVDVDLEQLQAVVGAAGRIITQAEWLTLHGIDELVEEGRRIWHESAGVGDLAALKARSRVREAEALVEPTGLGGFLVAEWVVGSSTTVGSKDHSVL